jgi:hypothetical protein
VGVALESCLAVLPRRCYDRYDNLGAVQPLEEKDSQFKIYAQLLQTVLLVYCRISEAQGPAQ